jgi:Putative zinc-finger
MLLAHAADAASDLTTWLVVMTREIPDELPNQELLSAFLDDELGPAERAMVEKHLATSEADRLLLAELKALRGDVAGLPGVAVRPGFTDRVVRAALAEAERHDASATSVSIAPTAPRRRSMRWKIGAAVASAAALAACFLLVVQSWRDDSQANGPGIVAKPAQASSVDPFLMPLRESIPMAGEAVVIRLRVGNAAATPDALGAALNLAQPDGSDSPLAQALAAALERVGIADWESSSPTGAKELIAAHQRVLETKYGSKAGSENAVLAEATVPAAEAVYVEAPLDRLEGALKELAIGIKKPLELAAHSKIPFARPQIAEGEPGSVVRVQKLPPKGQAFAQRLDASRVRLEKGPVEASTQQAAPAVVNPRQVVRVLILIEAE